VFTEVLLEDSWADFPLMRTMLELDMAAASKDDLPSCRADHALSEAIVRFFTIKGKAQHLLMTTFTDLIALHPRGAPSTALLCAYSHGGI
jgi:hypothetical protein